MTFLRCEEFECRWPLIRAKVNAQSVGAKSRVVMANKMGHETVGSAKDTTKQVKECSRKLLRHRVEQKIGKAWPFR